MTDYFILTGEVAIKNKAIPPNTYFGFMWLYQ